MLNHIVIMGRMTHDPERRETPGGTPVTSFTLAVDRDYSGKDGAEKKTDFIDVVTWRHTADFVSKFFSKGQMAVVSGRLQIRDWTDKDGNKRRSAEVVAENVYFGESKKREAPASVDGYPETGDSFFDGGEGYSGGEYSGQSQGSAFSEYGEDEEPPY